MVPSHKKTLHFFLFIFVSLALIAADHRKKVPPLHTVLSIITYPLKLLVDLPYDTTNKLTEFFTSHSKLTKENKKLRRLVTIYSARDQKYRSIAAQNMRLRKVLKTAEKYDDSYLLANILTVDADKFHQKITINKGTRQKVFEGQIALSGNSIYGQVIATSHYSSTIMQLSDVKHTIPVRNARTDETALAVGTGNINAIYLEHIENPEDVKIGDLYVSSGLGLLFPPDFPVAVVKEKHKDPNDAMSIITASTVTDFKDVREILLIWQAQPPAFILEEAEH